MNKKGSSKIYKSISYILVFLLIVIISSSIVAATNFTFQIETTSDSQNFSFQTDNTLNLSIDWGDGSNETFSDGTTLRSHNYSTAGTYNISLNGTASRISFYEGTPTLLKDILTPMSNSITGINNSYQMFRGATNITNFTAQDWFDGVSGDVTDMPYMFYMANNFNQNISSWNTSSVIDMSFMFLQSTSFNQSISNWDTSKVTDMSYMFNDASSFNQPLNNWNTSSVTNMFYTFRDATSFNQNLSNWDTSSVTNMGYMFRGASFFNQNLSNWDTSSVTSMSNMFYGATSFNQPLDNWDTSSVTTMFSMFNDASSFNQPLNNWNTSSVTDMQEMFYGATSFNQPLDNWDTSKIPYMYGMFYGTTSFNQPLNNWDTSKVIDMWSMFDGATSFNQNLSNWNVSSVTTMGNMFQNVTLSTVNYNALLVGWSSLPSLQNNTIFSGGNSRYSSGTAATAKQNIIDTYNWTITDGGVCTESWTCTEWSTCSGGTQTRTCTDSNSCGTENNKPAESQSCTVTPSSGGGGGSGIIEEDPTESHSWNIIEPDQPAEMEINNSEMDITKIIIDVSETVTDASIKLTKIDVVSQLDIKIGASGDTYQSFQIETTNLNDTNIANVTIEFKVNKTWADEQGLPEDISLYRKPDNANKWDNLITVITGSDDDYYYFSSTSPGLSLYSIILEFPETGNQSCKPGETTCEGKTAQKCGDDLLWETVEKCKVGCQDGKCVDSTGKQIYIMAIILTIGILILLALIIIYKKFYYRMKGDDIKPKTISKVKKVRETVRKKIASRA